MTGPSIAHEAGDPSLGGDGHEHGASLPKLETGIAGFDDVSMGGVPHRRATVVAGQAGSAKTIFAGQFLAEGVRRGQPGVFVTLEESADDLRANLATLGFDIAAWEASDDWRFVDASPLVERDEQGRIVVSPYRVDTLAAQIGHAVDATGAERLAIDSLNAVLRLHDDPRSARSLVRQLIGALRSMGVTVVLTVETPDDPGGALSSYGVEEFVADNVVLLHNRQEGSVRRRTLEILKMRGARHHKGEVSFTVVPGQGVLVLPMVRMHAGEAHEPHRISSGSTGLDQMLHGGLFSGSSLIVSGPTGVGKTLLATQFIGAGLAAGERCLHLAFEESYEQVLRSAAGWGYDFTSAQRGGLLHVAAAYPDVASLDDHLVEIEGLVRRFQPSRVALDSLTALEQLGGADAFREFTARLTATLKAAGAAALMTSSSRTLLGGPSVTESHVSALTDAIVLLRYVEVDGAVRRGLTVLKVRGTDHDSAIREYTITGQGAVMGEPFRGVEGVLSGHGIASMAATL
jgi:circadian clock protein KaiC